MSVVESLVIGFLVLTEIKRYQSWCFAHLAGQWNNGGNQQHSECQKHQIDDSNIKPNEAATRDDVGYNSSKFIKTQSDLEW